VDGSRQCAPRSTQPDVAKFARCCDDAGRPPGEGGTSFPYSSFEPAGKIAMTRDQFNWWGGALAIVLAVVSMLLVLFKNRMSKETADIVGKIVVAVWAILPPAFFWIDWVYFCGGLSATDKEIAKHTHDLARNIWLGLLGVITLGFFKIA
jgi:uncharacterized membrane protein YhaH (DUF805 family)